MCYEIKRSFKLRIAGFGEFAFHKPDLIFETENTVSVFELKPSSHKLKNGKPNSKTRSQLQRYATVGNTISSKVWGIGNFTGEVPAIFIPETQIYNLYDKKVYTVTFDTTQAYNSGAIYYDINYLREGTKEEVAAGERSYRQVRNVVGSMGTSSVRTPLPVGSSANVPVGIPVMH